MVQKSEDNKLKRRTVLKSVGAGATMLLGTSAASSAATKELENVEPVRSDLESLAQSKLEKLDVQNLLPKTMEAGKMQPVSNFHQGGNGIESPNAEIAVAAARQTLAGGNDRLVVAYVSKKTALLFIEYEQLVDGVQSEARLYDVDGNAVEETHLRLREKSINGEIPKKPTELPASADCDVCRGPGSRRLGEDERCVDIDLGCAAAQCGPCAYVCSSGPLSCISCVAIFCTLALLNCCTEWEREEKCLSCGTL